MTELETALILLNNMYLELETRVRWLEVYTRIPPISELNKTFATEEEKEV